MARLRMTNADYVAIAVSPPLIMALIGSLVFFLIEVLYFGSFEGRLKYVFALFVFASVLIARIAIEFGADRAALYTLPLGGLTFLAMMRFVDHQTAWDWLINMIILAIVWWCAHKLTWDCTLIDDNEDASGEGLLGQVGLDSRDVEATAKQAAGNELFGEATGEAPLKPPLWRRVLLGTQGPHAPGLWVLYFSLAALPLFGIGQHWVPASDTERRRYVFGLLAMYVASALALLVTTSFLGLRRYLRQRHVEMPGPMAATWVTLGAVLIVAVMMLAGLLPRPAAEYALAQPPWRAAAPGDLKSSEQALGEEGVADPDADERVTSDQANAPQHEGEARESAPENAETAEGKGTEQGEGSPQGEGQPSSQESGAESSDQSQGEQSQQDQSGQGEQSKSAGDEESTGSDEASGDGASSERSEDQPPSQEESQQAEQQTGEEESSRGSQSDWSPDLAAVQEHNQKRLSALGKLMSSTVDLLKFVFYLLLALVVLFFAWKYRNEIINAIISLVRDIRAWLAGLFGGRPEAGEGEEAPASPTRRRRTFTEFRDPFVTGQHQQISPVELVRYTFEAFEAWAGDHGQPRSPDQTPHELVQSVLAKQSPMYDEARRLATLYGEAAYSAATVSRDAAASLRTLWTMMRSQQASTSVPA
jgi:hypothetical protein